MGTEGEMHCLKGLKWGRIPKKWGKIIGGASYVL